VLADALPPVTFRIYKNLAAQGECLMKGNRRTAMLGMALLVGGFLSGSAQAQDTDKPGEARDIRHVLLISVDGMHAVDFLNCSKGIA
jgi:hypothetical protein